MISNFKDFQETLTQRKAELEEKRKAEVKNPENDWLLKRLEEIQKMHEEFYKIMNGMKQEGE